MVDVFAIVFYDDFLKGWRFHVWLNDESIVSGPHDVVSTPNESLSILEHFVYTVMSSPVHIHCVMYGSYADYELDLWQQYLDK